MSGFRLLCCDYYLERTYWNQQHKVVMEYGDTSLNLLFYYQVKSSYTQPGV